MRRPRPRRSPGSADQPPVRVVSDFDHEAQLQQIDAGLTTVAAQLRMLEQLAALWDDFSQIEGASDRSDADVTGAHNGDPLLAKVVTDNQRQRLELLDTARRLHTAREQLAPSETNPFDSIDRAHADIERSTIRRKTQDPVVAATEPALLHEKLSAVPAAPPTSAHRPTQPDTSPRQSTTDAPVTVVPDHAPVRIDMTTTVASANGRHSRRRHKTPLVIGGTVLLLLLTSATVLAASMLWNHEDDAASTQTTVPVAVATVDERPTTDAMVMASPTSSVGVSTFDSSPTTHDGTSPMRSPTPSSTTSPSPSSVVPSVQPTAPDVETIVVRVDAAEAALRSGQVDASVAYTDGTQSSTSLRFDLGATDGTAKIAMVTTYQSGEQIRTTEQIMIGAQVWERVDGGTWEEASNIEGAWGQVHAFLPRIARVAEPQRASDALPGQLHWYDAARNADVTVQVHPDTGQPEQLKMVMRATGVVMTVTYSGWNTPVQINPPVT